MHVFSSGTANINQRCAQHVYDVVSSSPCLLRLFQTGIFISENALYNFFSIKYSQFPYSLNVKRNGNKILISFDITKSNCFSFVDTYRENTTENFMGKHKEKDKEEALQQISFSSTQISEAFQFRAINPPSNDEEDLMFSKGKNYRHVKIMLDNDIVLFTRISVEGQDKTGKEILVKGLYDVPSFFSLKKNAGHKYMKCLMYNTCRINKWLAQAYLTGNYLDMTFL